MGEDPFSYDSDAFQQELVLDRHHHGEVTILGRICRPGACVLEIGANRGVTAVAISRFVTPTGSVHAFEPVPAHHEALVDNLDRNGADNVEAHRLALAGRRGPMRLYARGEATGLTPGAEGEPIQVRSTTVDDFVAHRGFRRVDVLNLDCEGSELYVLRGARELLGRQDPVIFCEVHRGFLEEIDLAVCDVVDYLESWSYIVTPINVEDLDAVTDLDGCTHIYAARHPQCECLVPAGA